MPSPAPGAPARGPAARRPRAPRRARPALEPLEGRSLPAGNLWITGASLVNAADQPVSSLVVGEEVFVEANWMSSGLSASDRYTVQFSVDGVSLDSTTIAGEAGNNLPFYWYAEGWFATPGSHTVEVTVDPAHTVSESSYSDNSTSFTFSPVEPATLPQKLAVPIAGTPFQTWSIVNYVDVNPLPGQANDYRGGHFTYDNHDGYDFMLPDFGRMDGGVPVFAAAAGTITQVQDGNFDRQTAFSSAPANFVDESLGNGYEAQYYHFMMNSIVVQAGQSVQAGQLLGYVGSSGNSTMAHLHFDLLHDGDLVETFDDPSAYWISPLPYQGDVAPTVTDSGITNYQPSADFGERPASVSVFPASSGWTVWYWFNVSYLDVGTQVDVKWYRPDGTVAFDSPEPITTFARNSRVYCGMSLPPTVLAADPGTWQVSAFVGGSQVSVASFQVTDGAGLPTIEVSQGSTAIPDNRTTPVDLGTVAQGGAGPQVTFTIQDIGATTVDLSGLGLPPGFTLVGIFPSSISAGSSADLTVALSSAAVGPQFGQITFQTNDPNAPTFGFNVSGSVTGTPPAGSPSIALSARAMAAGLGWPPSLLDPSATITDASPNGFAGGSLTVTMAGGGTPDDRLSIGNQGNGPGQIGFDGRNVAYGHALIGTAATSAGPATLVITLNGDATTAAVQALLDDITYQNVSSLPDTTPRFIRISAVDASGLASNDAFLTVVNSGRPPVSGGSSPISVPTGGGPTPTPTGPPPPTQPGPSPFQPISPPTGTSIPPLPAPAPTTPGPAPGHGHHPRHGAFHRRPAHPTHHARPPHEHGPGHPKHVIRIRRGDRPRPHPHGHAGS